MVLAHLACVVLALIAANEPPATPEAGAEVRTTQVAAVLVKDFLRLENSGKEVEAVEFLRYFPAADQEQFPIARWVVAATDDGEPIGVGVAAVHPDPEGNLIHTFRLDRAPAKAGVVVTVTSIVLRRERPGPKGEFPIPAPQKYPARVREYLASTPMVVYEHAEVRQRAEAMLTEAEGDALRLARIIARHMNTKKYLSEPDAPWDKKPTSAVVLEYGGSCCSSAVGAAAIFRACGVPAQVTYTPAGYVHGVVQFYLDGYGWVRMDATCQSARVPLFHDLESRGLVRLFDTPIEMESQRNAYGWPYYHNTLNGPYAFWSGGRRVPHIRLASKSESAVLAGKANSSPFVTEPFEHLEPGSWNKVLRLLRWTVSDEAWGRIAAASRAALATDTEGPLGPVIEAIRAEGLDPKLDDLLERCGPWGGVPSEDQATAGSRR